MSAVLHRLLAWPLLIAAALAAGCAGAPPEPAPAALFDDAAFAAPARAPDAQSIFALDAGMRRFLADEIAHRARLVGPQRALVDALTTPGRLRLEYDATMTRNAAQVFEAHSGNCLSLVIMTAAFAKALDLRVDYNAAVQEQTWSRRANLLVRSDHVNVSFGRRAIDVGRSIEPGPVTIDFLPPDEVSGLRTLPIAEATIVAMYFNNRAVEALVDARLDEAYAYARAAMRGDPAFWPAYNTLGLVYRRHRQPGRAAQVFEYLLGRDPGYRQAIANLADAYDALGRAADAAHWRQVLVSLEPQPPFHFLDLGRAAAQRGDWVEARRQFERELARADYSPEVHFWLAQADLRLGDLDGARRHLALAMDNSTSGGDRALYAAKLARLKTLARR